MAYLCTRLLSKNLKSRLPVACRFYSDKLELPDPDELATGKEKVEMKILQSGDEDPFRLRAIKRKASSRNDPNIVESYYDCRVVGCVCEEDSSSIVWMWLFKGEPKRCYCGHWFKLKTYKPNV